MTRAATTLVALMLAATQSQTGNAPSRAATQSPAPQYATRNPADYVGDDTCRFCHQDKTDAYHRTAHYLTSRLPNRDSILGKFIPGENILTTANPGLFFRMDEKRVEDEKLEGGVQKSGNESGFFQTAVEGKPPHTTSRTERFDVVVGSGTKGQTYLFWKDEELFQLPVSYWTNLGWVNSPGYRDGFVNFGRMIAPRCLECHATYFENLPPPPNRFNREGFALGLQCEKCHGPGREHVQREQTAGGQAKSPPAPGAAILNPAHFPRDRQIDLCAWCHAHGNPLLPAFTYTPGDPLDKYLDLQRADPKAPLDVHGNQVGLLKLSRCFAASTMTCFTCHDVHVAQHNLAEFSQRCLGCHKPDSATFAKAGHPVSENCIDCHMPKQETSQIVFNSKGKKNRPQVRSHWIRVYEDEN